MLSKTVIQDKTPASVFVDVGSQTDDRLEERMTVCAEKSRETYRLFKKQKHMKSKNKCEPGSVFHFFSCAGVRDRTV